MKRRVIVSALSLILITGLVCRPVKAETFFHKFQMEVLNNQYKDIKVSQDTFKWLDDLEILFNLMGSY